MWTRGVRAIPLSDGASEFGWVNDAGEFVVGSWDSPPPDPGVVYAKAYHNAPPAPNNLGAGLSTPLVARNPRTGLPEGMVATSGEDGDQRFYFPSDGPLLSPYERVSTAYAGGYSTDNSGTFAHFMERVITGGLAAIGVVAAPAIIAGATAPAAGGAAAVSADEVLAGEMLGLSTPADVDAVGASVLGGATAGAAVSPLMPPAVPEVDPTFGGALQETAPGVFTAPVQAESLLSGNTLASAVQAGTNALKAGAVKALTNAVNKQPSPTQVAPARAPASSSPTQSLTALIGLGAALYVFAR